VVFQRVDPQLGVLCFVQRTVGAHVLPMLIG
jgi:hypothetical protein